MARITTRDVVAEVRALAQRMDQRFDHVELRIDGVHTRIDTLFDAIVDLRRDVSEHRHDD